MLTENELERYDRQILIDGFGREGQEKLKKAKVFIAGTGGLGSITSTYLTAAGVGVIRIADDDVVELSNLNRQILHWTPDIGKKKVASAREKLEQLNPEVSVEIMENTIDEDNILDLVGDSHLIVDAMDNFPTRYLLNRASLEKNIPLFYGAVHGFTGEMTTIIPGKGPCLRCIFPKAPPEEKFPVIGVTPAIIGCIQATEAIKYIVGIGTLLENKLLIWDGMHSSLTEIEVKKNPQCEECAGYGHS